MCRQYPNCLSQPRMVTGGHTEHVLKRHGVPNGRSGACSVAAVDLNLLALLRRLPERVPHQQPPGHDHRGVSRAEGVSSAFILFMLRRIHPVPLRHHDSVDVRGALNLHQVCLAICSDRKVYFPAGVKLQRLHGSILMDVDLCFVSHP